MTIKNRNNLSQDMDLPIIKKNFTKSNIKRIDGLSAFMVFIVSFFRGDYKLSVAEDKATENILIDHKN